MSGAVARMLIRVWLFSLLVAGTSHPVNAAEFFCPSGNVTCLIAAITEANALPGSHTIFLDSGTYTLTSVDNNNGGRTGLPSIRGEITIRQEGLDATIERDPAAENFRIFHVSASGKLTLYGLGVRNGLLNDSDESGGAAVFNAGTIVLDNTAIYDNDSENHSANAVGFSGGAINSIGRATIIDSEVKRNRTRFEGGGIANSGGQLTVLRSLIADNVAPFESFGGGIASIGDVTISDSTIVGNAAGGGGGGSGIIVNGTGTIINTTIARNKFSPAVEATGGGSHILSPRSATALKILNSTIAENSANVGAGVENFGGGILTLQNTVLAFNSGAQHPRDCGNGVTSLGNNIIGDPSGCPIILQVTDLTGDPGLDAFDKDHYPLLPNSRAVDHGNPDTCPATDQEGLARLGICDIGSVEFQGGRLPVSIDIRPKSDANKINPNSKKNINVAILSVNGFETNAVDPNTVRFGATGTEAAPIHSARRDVNGDGSRDLVMRFEIGYLGIQCGDTTATLTGQTSDGRSIIGSSPITTVQCKKQ